MLALSYVLTVIKYKGLNALFLAYLSSDLPSIDLPRCTNLLPCEMRLRPLQVQTN